MSDNCGRRHCTSDNVGYVETFISIIIHTTTGSSLNPDICGWILPGYFLRATLWSGPRIGFPQLQWYASNHRPLLVSSKIQTSKIQNGLYPSYPLGHITGRRAIDSNYNIILARRSPGATLLAISIGWSRLVGLLPLDFVPLLLCRGSFHFGTDAIMLTVYN